MVLHIDAMNAKAIGIHTIDLSNIDSAREAIATIGTAIDLVSGQRSRLGAYQNRLEHTINNLENVVENTTSSESKIRDADMAKLMVEYSNNRILLQCGEAILSQANQRNSAMLYLLS